ncbi:AfsR/SARP family transcriptional regulator [Streptomyces sp. GZWMJZ-114]|uniref:AfsR/SARP family transcriptional regulator n=1 Tax=Streptomyces sp. GZWMJZ-114 TaxID=2494734 RepID=UPI001F5052B4|nr:AfsR/SARP family transcriptional regulator [Streptomyces sp. GZWMJZ-114]
MDLAVLGPLAAYDAEGTELRLGGPRQRAVLARLLVARRQVVPLPRLVADLWDGQALPGDPEGAVRTFVAALRRVLEPGRRPRTAAKVLVTEGPGYALRAAVEDVDAWRFERAARAEEGAPALVETLEGALALWRGPAYADVATAPWARAEAARLEGLRLHVVERAAAALLARGGAARAVPDLEEFVAAHPAREEGWRLLALALYRSGRQAEALSAVRRARRTLAVALGLEPGARLSRLEEDILRQAPHLDPAPEGGGQVWARAAEAYARALPAADRSRLRTAAGLMRDVAVTGGEGLSAAREHRLAAVAEARRYGDAELTARVIGVYDVPALWTRSDDPVRAARLVAAAQDALRELPEEREAERARLLATVAVESRGAAAGARSLRASREAEALARRLGDPGLLVFALNGVFVQSFAGAAGGTGLAGGGGAGFGGTGAGALGAGSGGAGFAGTGAGALGAGSGGAGFAGTGAGASGTGSGGAGFAGTGAGSLGAGSGGAGSGAAGAWALGAGCGAAGAGALGAGSGGAGFAGTGAGASGTGSGGAGSGGTGAGASGADGGQNGDVGRDALGAELVAVAGAAGLVPHEVLGLLVRMQARCGLGDFAGAEGCAAAADALAARHGLPLVRVFTTWFRALRASLAGGGWEPYEEAVALLPGCGMPGFATGLPALARLTVAVRQGEQPPPEGDFGPYEPWVRPLLGAYGGAGEREAAREALARVPQPPADHLTGVLRGVVAEAARVLGTGPGPGGLVGAGSGVVALGTPGVRELQDLRG